MEKTAISDMLDVAMQKIREMGDANTIIGEPITTHDGVTLIPVSKLCLGIVGGGCDRPKKGETQGSFGGGIGTGVRIEPVAFMIVKEGSVRMIYVSPPSDSTLDKVIDTVPEVIDKITDFLGKGGKNDNKSCCGEAEKQVEGS